MIAYYTNVCAALLVPVRFSPMPMSGIHRVATIYRRRIVTKGV